MILSASSPRKGPDRYIVWTCSRCGRSWREPLPRLDETIGPDAVGTTICDDCLDEIEKAVREHIDSWWHCGQAKKPS